MSIVGDFTIQADSFILEHALSTVPDMTIEADRYATHGPKEVLPFIWASGSDFQRFQHALDDDPATRDVSVAEETDGEVLYRLKWSQDVLDLIQELVDHHAAILRATAQNRQWELRLRFADEGMISEFQNYFQETGRHFEVHQLRRPRGPRQQEYGLTPEQYNALVAALRAGYFKIPRGTSGEELGETLGISANAVSQRLRRGTETVLRDVLTIDDRNMEDS